MLILIHIQACQTCKVTRSTSQHHNLVRNGENRHVNGGARESNFRKINMKLDDKKLIRAIVRRVHPDLFSAHPYERAQNSQTLMSMLYHRFHELHPAPGHCRLAYSENSRQYHVVSPFPTVTPLKLLYCVAVAEQLC